MRRLLLLLATMAMVMWVAAPVALAQTDDLDCADFATQEEAQANLDADPSDPNGLDADGDGVACEALTSTEMEDGTMMGDGGAGGTEDLDCADFATQEEAQANLDADPSDPNGLDADNDGIACEEPDDGNGGTVTGGGEQYKNGGTVTDGDQDGDGNVITGTVPDTELPDTGGASLGGAVLLPAAGLLLAAGLIGMRMVRRQ